MTNIIKVGKSNIEGGCEVAYTRLLKQKTSDIVLVVFLSIITCGVFPLFLKWSFSLRRKFLYSKCAELNECTHFLVHNEDSVITIEKKKNFSILNQKTQVTEEWIGFNNRKLIYLLHKGLNENNNEFRALEYPVCEIPFSQMSERKYLTSEQIINLRREYGSCEKVIEIPNIFQFLLHEMTSPFYFLQYASVIIWFLQAYNNFAIIIISVQFAITLFNYVMTRFSLQKIQTLAISQQKCTVYRSDAPEGKLIDAKELVVGDIIQMTEKMVIPCDCILIAGELLMNEVSLTGESVPIPKSPINPTDESCFDYSSADHKKYYLFDGTTIFQTKPGQEQKILAKVIRVGFTSFKGQILRSVLFPRPTEFDFVSNSIKFFLGLAAVMLIVFIARIPTMYDLDFDVLVYFYKLFDTITWIIPPFLPIFQSLSMTFSLMRLRFKNVLGIEPQKTLVAGKVTHMCFDKTGTLTTTGIDVIGYYDQTLSKIIKISDLQKDQLDQNIYFKLFASCHGVYVLNGEFTGDMLDVEMLKYSNYKIQNSKDSQFKFVASRGENKLEVLNTFEFDSDLQRMSSIVHDTKSNKSYAFLKGAPERVKELCSADSIPKNFTQQLNKLSLKGFRVLGLSYREIDESKEDINSMQRTDLEQNLTFLGFLVLENKLKEDTAECIQRLNEGGVECKIISGDSPLTTLQTASECNILNPNQKIYLVDASIPSQQLTIQIVENEQIEPIQVQPNQSYSDILNQLVDNQEQIVVTGKVLEYFENYLTSSSTSSCSNSIEGDNQSSDKKTQQGGENQQNDEEMGNNSQNIILSSYQSLVRQASVFSRMRPEQKRRVIELLQQQHLKVGMIGDGANDCEAIKQGDIGISFSTADAALTAPFSFKEESIKCVEIVLADGRATMTSNIEIFRNIVMQNVLKFIGVMIMLDEAQNFGDFQYTFFSFLSGMPLLALLALSKPIKKLQPNIPDDKFYKLPNCASIYSKIIIFTAAMIAASQVLRNQDWHIVDKSLIVENGVSILRKEGELNTIVYLMILIFYCCSCFSYYISKPFKLPIYNNYFLSAFLFSLSAYCILMTVKLDTAIPYFNFSESLEDEHTFMGIILIISLAACTLAYCVEQFIIQKYIATRDNLSSRNVKIFAAKN